MTFDIETYQQAVNILAGAEISEPCEPVSVIYLAPADVIELGKEKAAEMVLAHMRKSVRAGERLGDVGPLQFIVQPFPHAGLCLVYCHARYARRRQ